MAPTDPRDAVFGIDLGTSAVKGVLVAAATGEVLAEAERPLELVEVGALGAEQDADAWWAATVAVLQELAGAAAAQHVRPRALGLTGQKHALLPLDAAGRPLHRAVLWCDGRALEETAEVHARAGRLLGKRTGSLAFPGNLLPKWLRLRRRAPDVAARATRLVFAKDWLRLRLTDTFATDRTEASSSLLFDIGRKAWAPTCSRCSRSVADAAPDGGALLGRGRPRDRRGRGGDVAARRAARGGRRGRQRGGRARVRRGGRRTRRGGPRHVGDGDRPSRDARRRGRDRVGAARAAPRLRRHRRGPVGRSRARVDPTGGVLRPTSRRKRSWRRRRRATRPPARSCSCRRSSGSGHRSRIPPGRGRSWGCGPATAAGTSRVRSSRGSRSRSPTCSACCAARACP